MNKSYAHPIPVNLNSATNLAARIWSKTTIIASSALLLIGVAGTSLRATTDQLIGDSETGSASGSATIDLNDYGVSSFSALDMEAYGNAEDATQEENRAFAQVSATGDGTAIGDGSENDGGYNVEASAITTAYDISQDENGHWIAADVHTSEGDSYNVDLGTGSLFVDAQAGGSGTGGGGSVYAEIDY